MDSFRNGQPPASAMLNPYPSSSVHLEIRLFYVRFAPCSIDSLPPSLSLRHLRRALGVSLQINAARIPDLNPATLVLKRDRVDRDAREVTYLCTDSVRISGSVEFEVMDEDDVVLCGSLERMDDHWTNGTSASARTCGTSAWSMDCYAPAPNSITSRRISGGSTLLIEVYIAGCCSGSPVILTKTIKLSPRKKNSRQGMLDSIPEDEEGRASNGFLSPTNSPPIPGSDEEDSESEMKYRHSLYSQDMLYTGEDGEISWFNAGVRVGVGISLGVCVGIGLGVGLLMRSYQATTRNFRRRFF